jgi:hypothetical protein
MHSQPGRAGDIQVETFVLVVLEILERNIRMLDTEEHLFRGPAFLGLWTNGSVKTVASVRTVVFQRNTTCPWLDASVIAGYELNNFDWRKRAGIEAYLIPRYWCMGASGVDAGWLIPQKVVSRTTWCNFGNGLAGCDSCETGMLRRIKPNNSTSKVEGWMG